MGIGSTPKGTDQQTKQYLMKVRKIADDAMAKALEALQLAQAAMAKGSGSGGGNGNVNLPLSDKGDLLYYDQMLRALKIGTEGQRLTVVDALPAWVTPPADTFDPDTILTDGHDVLLGPGGNVLTGPA